MPNNNNGKNGEENVVISWIITIAMFAFGIWPVGVILLLRMLTKGSISSKKTRTPQSKYAPTKYAPDIAQPIDVPAYEVRTPPAPKAAEAPKRSTKSKSTSSKKRKKNKIVANHGQGLIVAGAIIAALFGIYSLTNLVDMISFGFYAFMARDLLISSSLTAGGLTMLAVGISRRSKAKRYNRYLSLIGDNEQISIDALAEAMPTSYSKACDDLQDMLEHGYLPTGHIDAGERELVLTSGGLRKKKPAPKKTPKKTNPGILEEIRAINDDIDDEEMSRKIARIEEITSKILDYQKKNPDSAAELRSFLDYYLPTTLKILRSYAVMEEQGVEGKNISATKANIEGMMDKVVDGFERRLDKLFQNDALDITSDMQVLEQMLRKDGLTTDELLDFELK